MFVTKEELKDLNVKEVFESGKNFISIKDGRHIIYRVNGKYLVSRDDKLYPETRIPKYIQRKLV
ncbi:hypothetical protein O0A02_00615 [Staphylococcus pseudintermedius]|nr:hypothetical protein [Staphylococcus pseudintermedius]MDK3686874.1 hypothetical protein [Staphylococcus pseudintermedius]MDK3846687.1 hypothetical protein [Staphylococcus pseudintermedius]HEC2173937.1 hypothetical protein [Staphylococcus delphini]